MLFEKNYYIYKKWRKYCELSIYILKVCLNLKENIFFQNYVYKEMGNPFTF